MGKRYDMQRVWNEGRKDLTGHSLETQFAIMQCMFDMSETLALIYDKLCEKQDTEQIDYTISVPL